MFARKRHGILLVVALLFGALCVCLPTRAEARNINLNIFGRLLPGEARTLLNRVNAERASVGALPLTWDDNLEWTAAVRALECTIYYNDNHDRPDGSDCFSAYADWGSYVVGENIAIGPYDAELAHSNLVNSATHYDNIIYPLFRSMGAAGIEGCGRPIWVESFSARGGSGYMNPAFGGNMVWGVNVPAESLTAFFSPLDSLPRTGESMYLQLCASSYSSAQVLPTEASWRSSNPSVATVDQQGMARFHRTGTVTISAALKAAPGVVAEETLTVYAGSGGGSQTSYLPDDPFGIGSRYPLEQDYWIDRGDGTTAGARWYVYRAGKMRRNCWVELRGAWYYLGADGQMLVGWQKMPYGGINGWYYFNPAHDGSYGRMCTGWVWTGGAWFYLEPSAGSGFQGMMYQDRVAVLGGTAYSFDEDGRME